MSTAVITGASSGLGKAYVSAVLARYPEIDTLWLVARRRDLLREVAEAHPNKTVAAISLDLAREDSLELFEQLLRENNPEIRVLINNAGYGKGGDFYAANRPMQTGMIDLNCRALTAMTRLCLPYMPSGGTVLNVASIAAFAPIPRMTVYSAAKSYVEAFSKGLNRELRSRGIKVCAVCPGVMETDFWAVAGIPEGKSPLIDRLPKLRPDQVAAGSLRAAEAGRMTYTRGGFYKLYQVLAKLLPHNLLTRFTQV